MRNVFGLGARFASVQSCRYETPRAQRHNPLILGDARGSPFCEGPFPSSPEAPATCPLQRPDSAIAFASATEAPLPSVKVMRAGMRKFEPGAGTRATAIR